MSCGGRPPAVQTPAERRLGIQPSNPQAPASRQPEPFKRTILQPHSRWETLGNWLIFRVIAPQQRDYGGHWMWGQRTRSLAVWLIRFLARAPSFLYTVTGPCVTPTKRRSRDLKCQDCPFLVRQIVTTKGVPGYKRYCGSCNCPRWFMAELGIKNRLKRHKCPQGTHEDSQPWRELMEDDWKPESEDDSTDG